MFERISSLLNRLSQIRLNVVPQQNTYYVEQEGELRENGCEYHKLYKRTPRHGKHHRSCKTHEGCDYYATYLPMKNSNGFPVKYVANCFLQRDFEDGHPTISPMKIQKLVYCLHGWHLAITDEPAISTSFESWPYGPVEEQMYHIFKGYGNTAITDYAKSWSNSEKKAYVVGNENSKFYEILDYVAKKYMPFSALQLSAMTHQPGTPWSITREAGGGEIDNNLIKQHFRDLVKN